MPAEKGASTLPHFTLWVQRPEDVKPWIWGADYDDPSGVSARQRVDELRTEYPTYQWEVRDGAGR